MPVESLNANRESFRRLKESFFSRFPYLTSQLKFFINCACDDCIMETYVYIPFKYFSEDEDLSAARYDTLIKILESLGYEVHKRSCQEIKKYSDHVICEFPDTLFKDVKGNDQSVDCYALDILIKSY